MSVTPMLTVTLPGMPVTMDSGVVPEKIESVGFRFNLRAKLTSPGLSGEAG